MTSRGGGNAMERDEKRYQKMSFDTIVSPFR